MPLVPDLIAIDARLVPAFSIVAMLLAVEALRSIPVRPASRRLK